MKSNRNPLRYRRLWWILPAGWGNVPAHRTPCFCEPIPLLISLNHLPPFSGLDSVRAVLGRLSVSAINGLAPPMNHLRRRLLIASGFLQPLTQHALSVLDRGRIERSINPLLYTTVLVVQRRSPTSGYPHAALTIVDMDLKNALHVTVP